MECVQNRRDMVNSLTQYVLSSGPEELTTWLKGLYIKIGQMTSSVECDTDSIDWMGIQEGPLRVHLENFWLTQQELIYGC